MHAAQVKEGHMQVNGGFQMVHRLTETQAKPRKTAQGRPNAQIGAFHMASRDVARIRVSGDWDIQYAEIKTKV